MKFLVTGARGQLGKEWVDHLQLKGMDFSAFSSSELDITDKDQLKSLLEHKKPDVVINCAAYTKVDDAEENKQQAARINTEAVKGLAGLAKSMNFKLVHFSTDYVFSGTSEDQKKYPDGYAEDQSGVPINVYGKTKSDGENAITSSGCDHLIIRVSWLCGKHGNNFVKTMLRLGKERDELTIVNDQYGSPSFTENVVENTITLLNKSKSGIFHITSKGLISWYDLAKEVFDQAGLSVTAIPVSSSEFPTKAKRPSFSKLNTDKIATIDGIKIEAWKSGLKKLIEQLDL